MIPPITLVILQASRLASFPRASVVRAEPQAPTRIAARMKILAVPALLALSGCAASAAGPFEAEYAPAWVQFAAGPAQVNAGGVADLSLRNGAERPVGYSLCMAALERLDAGLWVPARSHAVSCPQEFASLPPGATASGQAALPASLAPGTYRFVTQLSASSENLPDVQLRSEPFRVD
jgi:hypothetical protein